MLAAGERCLILAMQVRKELQKEGLDFSVVNARFIKPLDYEMLENLQSDYVVTLEDNVFFGGFGSMVNGALLQSGKPCKIRNFAYKDEFIPQGSVVELQKEYGVSGEEIKAYIRSVLL